MPKKKLSKTEQWMRDHPDDTPCPRGFAPAKAWRVKRGLHGNAFTGNQAAAYAAAGRRDALGRPLAVAMEPAAND